MAQEQQIRERLAACERVMTAVAQEIGRLDGRGDSIAMEMIDRLAEQAETLRVELDALVASNA